MDKFNYIVEKDGRPILRAPLSCRYDKETELRLLETGYTIRIDGKKLTKKELKA